MQFGLFGGEDQVIKGQRNPSKQYVPTVDHFGLRLTTWRKSIHFDEDIRQKAIFTFSLPLTLTLDLKFASMVILVYRNMLPLNRSFYVRARVG